MRFTETATSSRPMPLSRGIEDTCQRRNSSATEAKETLAKRRARAAYDNPTSANWFSTEITLQSKPWLRLRSSQTPPIGWELRNTTHNLKAEVNN